MTNLELYKELEKDLWWALHNKNYSDASRIGRTLGKVQAQLTIQERAELKRSAK